MNIRDFEVYKREGCEITPNSFTLYRDDNVKKGAFILTFAEVKKNNRVDILSEIALNEEGIKAIFKKTLDTFLEYKMETGRDLVKECIKELENEDGGDQ